MSTGSAAFPRPLKRKLNDPTATFARTESKAAKHSAVDSPRCTNGHPAPRAAHVENEQVSEKEDSDTEAGPELPPDDEDNEDEGEDDEDGRFFGTGMSKQEQHVLDYLNDNDDQPDEEINLAWLKRTALNFERKITKNAELRAKFEEEPMKFVSSEADLDSEIKGLSLLSGHPELYRDLVRSGCSDSIVGLLAHDNTDIAIAACELIAELIDEDTGASAEDWSSLVKSMLKADLVGLLISNLRRLDETNETDGAGVYHVLNVLENLLSDPSNAESIGSQTKILEWLLNRIKQADSAAPNGIGQNRQYSAEVLVILAQNHDRTATKLVELQAIDTLLQLLSTWRRKDPEKDSEEEEFAENLFDCLVTLCKGEAGCEKFIADEGIELCLIMLKEGKFSRQGAIRVLDHGCGGANGGQLCDRLVEAGGLKSLFTTFMKPKKLDRESTEHLIGIFSSMLRLLPATSTARIRVLAKFMEKDYEKCQRLLEVRKEYLTKLATAQAEIEAERADTTLEDLPDKENEWLLKRIDNGLFPLQNLNVIIAWLIAEDEGARSFFIGSSSSLMDGLKASLREQHESLDVEASSEALDTSEMLKALVAAL